MTKFDFYNSQPTINLVPLAKTHLSRLVETVNHPDVARWLPFHSPFDMKQAVTILSLSRSKKTDYTCWMIESQEEMNSVGVLIMQSQYHPQCLQFGYWIVANYHRRGYASQAMKLICEVAFDRFHAIRLQAQVHVDNVASIRLLEKIGFIRESLMPGGIAVMNDVPADAYMYVRMKEKENKNDQ